MTIAIATPTGNVGRHLTRLLLQGGIRPRVLVRDPAKLDPALRELVAVVPADLLDATEVVAATTGVTALYWVDPPTELDDPLVGYQQATDALVAAIQTNHIDRVVFQSSVGAELRAGVGDIDGLALTEVALDELGGNVTHLRCGYFFSNLFGDIDALRSGQLVSAQDPDLPLAWVAPADIAAVAAARLLNPDWSGRCVQAVHGPADLTFRQVAALLGTALGRHIELVPISVDDLRAQLSDFGLGPARIAAIVGMTTGFWGGFTPDPPRDYTTTTPTELVGWAKANLAPLLT